MEGVDENKRSHDKSQQIRQKITLASTLPSYCHRSMQEKMLLVLCARICDTNAKAN